MENITLNQNLRSPKYIIPNSTDEIAECYLNLIENFQSKLKMDFNTAKEISCELVFKSIYAGLILKKLSSSKKTALLKISKDLVGSDSWSLRKWDMFFSEILVHETNSKRTILNRLRDLKVKSHSLSVNLNASGLNKIIDGTGVTPDFLDTVKS